ncbi:MAG TPA: hypothetical protein VN639_00310 [Azonexus sp.]|nr:hypothetical protein [Azonexus sp.]
MTSPLDDETTVTVDRRSRTDRRQFDSGPPRGCFERRRRAERRLPTAEENTISDAEWELYFGAAGRAPVIPDAVLDHAAEVLDKARGRS